MKKVVLINVNGNVGTASLNSNFLPGVPTGPHLPLALVSLASYLKKNMPSSAVWMLDEQFFPLPKIEQELNKIKPDIVGISSVFKNYVNALKLARAAKRNGARVVMGGYYATPQAGEIMKNRGPASADYCIDAVIRYDGEKAFYQYVKDEPTENIDNLVYSRKGKIIENKIKSLNLDELAPLEFDGIMDPQIYFKEYQKRFPHSLHKRPFTIYSQKGCRWRNRSGGCIFCSLMYGELRLRDPKKVWQEIDGLVSDYGIDYIWDAADDLLSSKEWFTDFYGESKRHSRKPFFKIQARVDDLVDENVVKMLSDMNVVHIFVGFESNDDKCLAQFKKGTNEKMNEKVIHLLKKYKLSVRAYFVLGAPGENKKSLVKTVNLAEKIIEVMPNSLIVAPFFIPLPGSLAYRLLKQKLRKKYAGKDIVDWDDSTRDWIKQFCTVSYEEIKETRDYLYKFPHDITAYSY